MNTPLAMIDAIAACLFVLACLVAARVHLLAASRTQIWIYVAAAFLVFAVERTTNALEWGHGERFQWLDAFQGYLSLLASAVLAGIVLHFNAVIRRAQTAQPEGDESGVQRGS